MWDSGVRGALHKAAKAVGCDFPGLGPHSFRRANISWRQEVGGSSIEASKIAGHSEVDIKAEYTFVGVARQEALTKAIQDRLAQLAPKGGGPSPTDDARREQAARARQAKPSRRRPRWSRSTRRRRRRKYGVCQDRAAARYWTRTKASNVPMIRCTTTQDNSPLLRANESLLCQFVFHERPPTFPELQKHRFAFGSLCERPCGK